jgi:hypothetical protein
MKTFSFGLFSVLLSVSVYSQRIKGEQKAVKTIVDQLFTGMRNGDSAMVRATFVPNAVMYTTYFDHEGKSQYAPDSLNAFLIAVGTPHNEIWDERLLSCEIRIDDNLATVWTKYAFYVDNTYSHEGVNAFQLVKTNGEWKILTITDTRRRKEN